MAEFKLPYTASEINRKLEKVDSLASTVNGIAPDADGNIEIASGGIIDVLELPTENINEGAFYRLMTAKFVLNKAEVKDGSICYCVETLPETGEVVTDSTMSRFIAYYTTTDNGVYGYVDSALGSAFSVPAGWYPFSELASIASMGFNGVLTDISDDPSNNYYGLLLEYSFYLYKNDWRLVPFAYEIPPKLDVQWDGDMTGRPALDMSSLGFASGMYFVKISDSVPTINEVIGGNFHIIGNDGSKHNNPIYDTDIDNSTYPGAFTIANYIVVMYDEATLSGALGIPSGIYTNGTYFWLWTDEVGGGYVSSFTTPSKITKIDEKFLPDMSVDVNSLGLHSVATTGNYNSLNNRPNLSNYVTTSEVETMISTAIGSAIGGSY